jgi:acetyl-CoA synthetase (ADP-forming)
MNEADDLLDQIQYSGQRMLNEQESRKFLSIYGLPFPREISVSDPDSATQAAGELGYPVVLKILGPGVSHKTELGGVSVNLRSPHEVQGEASRLLSMEVCESLLIQEYIQGNRELVCGLVRKEKFGPCVMFGIGGVLTEIFSDVVFRLAPLSKQDAIDMIWSIRYQDILGEVRGENQSDIDTLSSMLVTLGEIGNKHQQVQEIDLNPVILKPDGTPVAVDALVILK